MKKFLKVFLVIIIIGAIGVGGYFIYNKFFSGKVDRDAFATIPEDAIFIVETTDLSKAWTNISSSDLWHYLIKTSYFADINEDIKMLDKYLKSNKIASMLLKDRKLIISAHMTSGITWDFLFTVDLKDMSGTFENLESAIGLVPGYKMEKKKFTSVDDSESYNIIELTNETNPKDKIFISFVDNIILVSFTGTIIEKAIEQRNDNHWNENDYFTEIINELSNRELFKIYFSYAQLNKFSKSFLSTEDDIIKMMSESLAFSIFDLNISGKTFTLDGFTNLDSANSYVRALVNVDPGKMRAYEIMTDQTAAYFNICFDDYMVFYNNLMAEYRETNPAEVEEIEKSIALVEKLLKIDLQKDFFSWIGNEIALFKIRPLSADSREEDIVLAINANDIDLAKDGLGNITKQIRRRSPLKFDIIEYKNFEINYLERKNFFKMFFGELFNKLEKPYFTYIEDYVVFSNSLELLMQVIDDYIGGRTLSHNVKFQSFIDEFNNKTNISIFIQMPKMYTTLYFYTPEENKEAFKENREMILSFARVGFQLNSDGQKFETVLLAEYDDEALLDDEVEKLENETKGNMFNKEIETMEFAIELPTKDLKNGQFKDYYGEDSLHVKFEGNVKDYQMNGMWRTFYESGNLKNSVNYKEGKVSGIAYFYYDDKVNTQKAEIQFEENKIVETYQEFYDNGAQKNKIDYKDGKMDGDAEFFYRTGRIKITGKYKDGEKNGKWIYYNQNEQKIKKEKWKNGKKK